MNKIIKTILALEEIDILAESAYQIPTKKWINNRDYYAKGYNDCLKRVRDLCNKDGGIIEAKQAGEPNE